MKKQIAEKAQKRDAGLTLNRYAQAKMFDVAFLRKLGLTDGKFYGQPAVRIPYRDTAGHECGARFRLSMDQKKRFRAERGTRLCLYGLWRIKRMLRTNYVVLVEGESDAQTCWQHKLPALGLPGANSWREEWAAHLAGFEKIYAIVEPDKGGQSVLRRIAKSRIRDRVYLVRLNGAKDPSELYLKDPKKFRDAIQKALSSAARWTDEKHKIRPESTTWSGSRATHLVGLAGDMDLFHTPDDEPYASLNINGHWETVRLRDRAFRRRLAQLFYQEFGGAPSSQAMTDAVTVLEGQALYEGPQLPIHVRLAEQDGAIFLDLANEAWEAVEITATGWRLIARPPVRFRRPRGMMELPHPVAGGTVNELRPFVNIADDENWVLHVSWLVQALRPRGPFPVLVLQGEQGSAKSTLAKICRALVDPNSCPLRSEPRELRDLMIAANNGWCVAFDNVSALPARLADAICRLSTGAGFSTRELYTDEEERLFSATRPVLLNGIDGLVVRGDLQDRAVASYLPTIPANRRRPEQEFWQAFELSRPRILGALLDGVSTALRRLPVIRITNIPRMADFILWASAARTSFGWARGRVLGAYRHNRESSNSAALEASPLVPAIEALLSGEELTWIGTATQLLKALTNHRDQAFDHDRRSWPQTSGYLSTQLRRLAPNLRAAGINVEFRQTTGSNSKKYIAIEKTEGSDADDAATQPSAE